MSNYRYPAKRRRMTGDQIIDRLCMVALVGMVGGFWYLLLLWFQCRI